MEKCDEIEYNSGNLNSASSLLAVKTISAGKLHNCRVVQVSKDQ